MRYCAKVYDPKAIKNGIWQHKDRKYYIHLGNKTCVLLNDKGEFSDDVSELLSEILKNGEHIKLC